jgi:hypothetical protein
MELLKTHLLTFNQIYLCTVYLSSVFLSYCRRNDLRKIVVLFGFMVQQRNLLPLVHHLFYSLYLLGSNL